MRSSAATNRSKGAFELGAEKQNAGNRSEREKLERKKEREARRFVRLAQTTSTFLHSVFSLLIRMRPDT